MITKQYMFVMFVTFSGASGYQTIIIPYLGYNNIENYLYDKSIFCFSRLSLQIACDFTRYCSYMYIIVEPALKVGIHTFCSLFFIRPQWSRSNNNSKLEDFGYRYSSPKFAGLILFFVAWQRARMGGIYWHAQAMKSTRLVEILPSRLHLKGRWMQCSSGRYYSC